MITAKTILVNAIWIICFDSARAQANIDSIDNVLKTSKDDTSKVTLLLKTGKALIYTLPDKAHDYWQLAIVLSKKINYPLGLEKAYVSTGTYYLNKTETNPALRYYQLADSICHKHDGLGFKESMGTILSNYGAIQQRLGNYLEAIQLYIRSSKILDSLHNKTYLPYTYYNLASLYENYKQFDKQEFYAKACMMVAEEAKNTLFISMGCLSLADALIQQRKFDKALPYILKAKKTSEMINNHYLLGICYSDLGLYYGDYKKDYNQAISYEEKAIEQAKLLGNSNEEVNELSTVSNYYLSNNQFDKARITATKAYELLQSFKFTDMEQYSLYVLAQTEAHFGEYKKAYDHLLKSTELKDTVFKEDNRKQINYLEALYQSEKKEKEINQLQSEKRISELTIKRRNIFIYALFVTIALLIGIAFLFYRNIRNKRIITERDLEIERQMIKELEKDRQIVATRAVLQGEEIERQRLARDLHDGLGGLLFGVKLSFANMKGNMILSQESVQDFDRSLSMLDTSIIELRRVAHNMMPETLLKFGLKDMMTDFCKSINDSHTVDIKYQFIGQFERVDQQLEFNAFRILQELIVNAIKHSGASELVVQIIQEPDRLCLITQDNGSGFDMEDTSKAKGIGLNSVKSRVESMKGKIDINTAQGKGTEISVEFCLQN